jgi:hypothetical protein
MLSNRKYSFNKLTHFSKLNNVLDPTASNVEDFLTRDTVTSIQFNGPLWHKGNVPHT